MSVLRLDVNATKAILTISQFMGFVLALIFLLFVSSVHGQTGQAPAVATAIVIGTDQPETSFVGRWQRQIYTEAFTRLGMRVSFAEFAPPRLSLAVESGDIDGEVTRTYDYGTARPELVRAEESVFSIVFAIYTADPALRAEGLKDLASGLSAEYRRGVLGCENALKGAIPANRLSDILTTQQGLKKLVANRTAFYCDIDLAVLNEMTASNAVEFASIRKLFAVGNSTPLYPYLNKKHAALAPRLAATLKQMKSEGVIDRYRLEALREFGHL